MSFADSIRTCMSKYATFSGRARRSEFWWFSLFLFLVYLVLIVLDAATHTFLFTIVMLAFVIPSLAVTWRRLHDTGRSGGWFFIGLVPFVGGIALLVFECMDSQPGTNQYGPSPKGLGGPNPGAYGDPFTNPQGA